MIALPAPETRRPQPPLTIRRAPTVAPTVNPSTSIPLSTGYVEGEPSASQDTLAEALAKVKTPQDDELAQQQAAFDRLMQARAEQLREANAIRDLGMEQMKKENAYMEAFIKMI